MIGIYKLTNIRNNKVYIGSSKQIELRINHHFSLLKRNKHHSQYLQNTYNKYGKEVLKFEVIEKHVDYNKIYIIEREQYWVDYYKSYKPEFGYNEAKVVITSVKYNPIIQYSLDGNFIKEWESSDEVAKFFNTSRTSVNRACHKENVIFKNCQWKYKFRDKEFKNLLMIYVQYDIKGNFIDIFFSLKEIKDKYNIGSKSNVIRACSDNKLSFNSLWKKYDTFDFPLSIAPYERDYNFKKVIQLDKNENIIKIFDSIKDASIAIDSSIASISRCLSNSDKLTQYKTCKGYKWKYYTEPLDGDI